MNIQKSCLFLGIWIFSGLFPIAQAADVDVNQIANILGQNNPASAREKIQTADNSDEFLSTPLGQALYSASVCYSPMHEINEMIINDARKHINNALQAQPPMTSDYLAWANQVKQRCDTCLPQLRRVTRIVTTRDTWGGKIAHQCDIQTPSEITLSNKQSLPSLPRIPLLDGSYQVPDEFLERVKKEHQGENTKVAACGPFIVATHSDSTDAICASSQKFLQYFSTTFSPPSIDAWIVIHHYNDAIELNKHAEIYGGPPCKGIFGYFDPISQRIVYQAPAGLRGTLNHELTHAFIYWDAPELPRWLEEGIAALHENTDNNYNGLPNPWRQKYLMSDQKNRNEFCSRIFTMEIAEFESHPQPASISRYAMRQIQTQGKLGELYQSVKADPSLEKTNYDGVDQGTAQRLLGMPGIKEFCSE